MNLTHTVMWSTVKGTMGSTSANSCSMSSVLTPNRTRWASLQLNQASQQSTGTVLVQVVIIVIIVHTIAT